MTSEEYKEQLSRELSKLAGSLPLGFEYVRLTGQTAPHGGVDYLGQEATRAMYADLWVWLNKHKPDAIVSEDEWQTLYAAQNGNVSKFSTGDGSTTFRFPRMVGYTKGATGASELGQYVKEGLPNITWSLANNTYPMFAGSNTMSTSGAMSATFKQAKQSVTVGSTSSNTVRSLDVDASRSSVVYGNSQHVTPETVTVVMGVIAIGAVAGTLGEVDKEGVVAELSHLGSSKADTDASNFSTAGKNVLAGMGMPSSRYIDLTLGASEATYTAPADGWLIFAGSVASGSSGSAWVLISGPCGNMTQQGVSSGAFAVYAPFTKGQNFTVQYNNITMSDSWARFRFIYAEGAS